MALQTFTDNVIVLAVENCLLIELPGIFTTERVIDMDDDELERLASESAEIIEERARLQGEYDALRKGLKACAIYRGTALSSKSQDQPLKQLIGHHVGPACLPQQCANPELPSGTSHASRDSSK